MDDKPAPFKPKARGMGRSRGGKMGRGHAAQLQQLKPLKMESSAQDVSFLRDSFYSDTAVTSDLWYSNAGTLYGTGALCPLRTETVA